MDRLEIYKTIRQIVEFNLPGSRVLLFGSRARESHDHFSDYDLLIITPLTFTSQDKMSWSTRLNHAIVKALKIPVDLLINSEEEISEKRNLPGHIIRTAMKEGVRL